jgi:hypothetical protein
VGLSPRGAALLAAGAAAGALAGLVVSLLADESYRSTAVLQVAVDAPGEASGGRLPAEVLAESHARLLEEPGFLEQVAPQVQGGRYTAAELDEATEARRVPGTTDVELAAEADTQAAARGLATDLAAASLAAFQQRERERARQVQDALQQRLEELPADAEAERAALQAEITAAAARGAQRATALELVAAPPAEAERAGAPTATYVLVGLAAGLVVGTLLALVLRERRPAPARVPVARAPEPAPAVAPAAAAPEPVAPAPREPAPALVEPAAGAVLTGVAEVRAAPAAPDLRFERSRDRAAWIRLDGDPGDGALRWDTEGAADGRWLLRSVSAAGASEPVAVFVDNAPPAVALVAPAEGARVSGVVRLEAEAADEGSGVASVAYHLSAGGPDWTEIPQDWDTTGLGAGTYWLSAVATDRAGLAAATPPRAVVVDNAA